MKEDTDLKYNSDITEYPELAGIHKDHWLSQLLLVLHKTPPRITLSQVQNSPPALIRLHATDDCLAL